jgi:hypothetical protein
MIALRFWGSLRTLAISAPDVGERLQLMTSVMMIGRGNGRDQFGAGRGKTSR